MNNKDSRRVVIIDYNPLVHKYLNGGAPPLSHTLNVNGTPVRVDTTIQNYTIKAIHRWSNNGLNPTAVCFDSPCPARKVYFARQIIDKTSGESVEYKDGRERLPSRAYDAINMTIGLLYRGGVSVYKVDGFESDDLIYECVKQAKIQYPDLPIDIICNDADFLPLVDDQVSVFFRTRKQAWAENSSLLKKGYIQVTPGNFQEVCEGISQYKKLEVPYNSLLLAKLLRGDSSDKVPGKPDWKPKMYRELITVLEEDGVEMDTLFRYGGEEQLAKICEVLGRYVEPEDLEHIRTVYRGIDLNGAFEGVNGKFARKPATITSPIKPYNAIDLQQEVSKLNINLPMI